MRALNRPFDAKRARERDEALDRNLLGARGRVDAGGREQRQRIGAERFQALAQHLAALAEGGLGDALERAAVAGERLRRAGRARTSDEVTFGGGTKAVAAMSNRMRASLRQPASTDSRP